MVIHASPSGSPLVCVVESISSGVELGILLLLKLLLLHCFKFLLCDLMLGDAENFLNVSLPPSALVFAVHLHS